MSHIFVCGLGFVLCAALSGCGGSGSESPTIEAFAPASDQIQEGGSTTLNARFSGGGGAVDQGIGPVQSGSSVTVRPTDNAVYTLTVTAEDGSSVNASTTVRIVYDEIWDFASQQGWLLDTRFSEGEDGGGATAVIDSGALRLSSSQGFDGACAYADAWREFGDAKLRSGSYASMAVSLRVISSFGAGMGYPTFRVIYRGKQVRAVVPDGARLLRIEWAGDEIVLLADGVAQPPTALYITDSSAAPAILVGAYSCAPDLTSISISVDSVEVSAR